MALSRTQGDGDLPAADQLSSGETDSQETTIIPGTSIQWAWDATSLAAYKKCPRFYQYAILEGRTGEAGIHLRFGIEVHKALEDYDRSRAAGISHDDSLHDVLRATIERVEDWEPEPQKPSEEMKTKYHLVRVIVEYLDHYNPDPARTFMLANGEPAVELNFRFEMGFMTGTVNEDSGEPYAYSFCGYLDRIVDFNGELFVMDRKTTSKTVGSYYFTPYDLDTQMTLYTLAGRVLLQSPIRGVIVDAIQIAKGFIRPVRSFTYRTPDHLDEFVENSKHWIEAAERNANENYWPMNEGSCNNYGGCAFREVCAKSPNIREKFLPPKGETWNPLKPR